MDDDIFDTIFTEANASRINELIDKYCPTFYVRGSMDSVVTCSIVRSATAVCVFRNGVDKQTGNATQEFKRGTIKKDGTIGWNPWT